MTDEISSTSQVEAVEELAIDPVCGASVDVDLAADADLITSFAGGRSLGTFSRCRGRDPDRPVLRGTDQRPLTLGPWRSSARGSGRVRP